MKLCNVHNDLITLSASQLITKCSMFNATCKVEAEVILEMLPAELMYGVVVDLKKGKMPRVKQRPIISHHLH